MGFIKYSLRFTFNNLVCLAILFTLNIQPLFAQHEIREFSLTHINSGDGLSHDNIMNMLQDKQGYIWIATSYGLNKYDGMRFKTYKHNPLDTTTIADNIIRNIEMDNEGNIWALTDGGISKYNPNQDNFTNFYIGAGEKNGLLFDRLSSMKIDCFNLLWLRYSSKGIFIFDLENRKRIKLELDNDAGHLSLDNNGRLVLLHNNRIYFYPRKEKFDFEPVIFEYGKANSKALKNTKINRLAKDKNGLFWFFNQEFCKIISMDEDEIVIDRKDFTTEDILKLTMLESTKGLRIDTRFDNKNNPTFIVNDKFFFYYDTRTKKFIEFRQEKSDPVKFGNDLQQFYIDNANVFWFATNSIGVFRFDPFSNNIFRMSNLEGNAYNLHPSKINDIMSDDEGQLWITTQGHFSRLQRDTSNIFNFYPLPTQHNLETNPFDFTIGPQGDLWAGTVVLEKLTNDITSENLVFKRYRPEDENPDIFPGWNNWAVNFDHEGNLWFGNYLGLNRLPKNEKNKPLPSFKHYSEDDNNPNSLSHNTIWCIYADRENDVWIGTNSGLNKYLPEKDHFLVYKNIPGDSNSISNNNIKCIYQSAAGTIWIGTEGGGLNNLIKSNNRVSFYTEKNGLLSDIVWGICEDDHGNLWLNTHSGISRFDPVTETFTNYPFNNEQSYQVYGKKGYHKDKYGINYFAGNNGIYYFHPDSIKKNNFQPNIVFTDFKIFNESVPINEEIFGKKILSKHINDMGKIEIGWNQNSFTLEFAALHFSAPGKIKYAYKMSGFDKSWITTSANQRYANYTNLPHGNYTFMLKATNCDGVWNKYIKTLDIKILPPFWETWGFRIFVVLTLIGLVGTVFWWRMRNMRIRQMELKNQVKERTAEIESQKEELQVQAEKLQSTNLTLQEQKDEIEAQSEELRATMEELHNTNQELEKLNVTKDKFFSIIAHDLKNPFHAISGMSSILDKSYDSIDDNKKREFIQMISSSSKSASGLLENLLTWSRSQTNKIKFNPITFNLDEIVRETFNLLLLHANKKKISLESKIAPDTMIYADSNMITTVIRNLLSNAIKFTPEDGKITIGAKSEKNTVVISISDTGVGMKKETVDQLFKIDQQQSTSGTAGEGGTGLGLIICNEFIEKNNGEIHVDSEPGKGSVFHITLPLSEKDNN